MASNDKKEERINFKYNFGVYLSFLKKYKLLVALLLIVVLIQEIKIVVDKYLFKVIIDNGTGFVSGTILSSQFLSILSIVAIVFFIAAVSGIVANWLTLHFINRLEVNIIADLKRKYFDHILTLDHSFHVSHKTGSMISRLIRGGSALERITDVIVFNFLSLSFQLVVIVFSLIYLDLVSAIVIVITVTIFISYSFYIQRLQENSNLEMNRKEDIEKATISDIFTNIDSVQYFGKEDVIKGKYLKISEETRKATLLNWDYWRIISAGQVLILTLGTFFVVYFPLMSLLKGNITLGTLTFIYSVYLGLIGNMFGFVSGIRGFYRSMADFQDLFEYGKVEKEIKDKGNAKELEINEGEIEFKNVTFRYEKRTLFKDFNLKIPRNKKVALVGHSGSGKTTLVKLLYRFYDVDGGEILVDGKDIKDLKQESLRSELSIVPQECILFDDSIFNNVKFANPKASYNEVMQAIKFAQLDRIIKSFPLKEKTIVGERGVKLSGGEKQRVSIARAILANKKVLVLDEATSSLDSETEYEIQKALAKLLEGRTSIIIAHRLSTIMHADKIIVMKQGKIVQAGTHQQLIKQEGEYKKLWNLQKGGYIK